MIGGETFPVQVGFNQRIAVKLPSGLATFGAGQLAKLPKYVADALVSQGAPVWLP